MTNDLTYPFSMLGIFIYLYINFHALLGYQENKTKHYNTIFSYVSADCFALPESMCVCCGVLLNTYKLLGIAHLESYSTHSYIKNVKWFN